MQRRMRRPHLWRTVLSFFFLLYRKFKLVKTCLFSFFSFYLSKKKKEFFLCFFFYFLKTVRYTNVFYIFFPHAKTCSFSEVDFGPWFAFCIPTCNWSCIKWADKLCQVYNPNECYSWEFFRTLKHQQEKLSSNVLPWLCTWIGTRLYLKRFEDFDAPTKFTIIDTRPSHLTGFQKQFFFQNTWYPFIWSTGSIIHDSSTILMN